MAPASLLRARTDQVEKPLSQSGNMEQPDTNDMRGLAIGISDFKRIRERDDFYVDKTGLIEFILDHDSVCAFLFTRPRRFGKSLNLSMIDAFFNMRYEGDRWFKGLKITENAAYREHLNGYPVVSMNLKDVLVGSIDEFLGSMRRTIRDLYDSHPCLSNSSALTEFQRKSYGSVVRMEDGPILEYAIRDLCDMLCAHHGRPAIVLIDEYDGPINRAEGEVKEKVLQFMRTLLSASLKDSQSLKFGVLTGVLQIAKENIFSGLNNLYVNNVFSEDMGEAFGFTEEVAPLAPSPNTVPAIFCKPSLAPTPAISILSACAPYCCLIAVDICSAECLATAWAIS